MGYAVWATHVDSSACCYSNYLAYLMSNRLAITYSQTGVRGIFRSLIRTLANLRENIWFWRVLTPGAWVRALKPLVLSHAVLLASLHSSR